MNLRLLPAFIPLTALADRTIFHCGAIEMEPIDSNNVIAGFGGGLGGNGLWGSGNGDTTWINRAAGLPDTPVFDLASVDSRILPCNERLNRQDPGLHDRQDPGLYESTDYGITWTASHAVPWPGPAITVNTKIRIPRAPSLSVLRTKAHSVPTTGVLRGISVNTRTA